MFTVSSSLDDKGVKGKETKEKKRGKVFQGKEEKKMKISQKKKGEQKYKSVVQRRWIEMFPVVKSYLTGGWRLIKLSKLSNPSSVSNYNGISDIVIQLNFLLFKLSLFFTF